MSQVIAEPPYDLAEMVKEVREKAKQLVTEDDEPVDNLYSGIQQRLLVEPLHSSWTPPQTAAPRPFLAQSNVGLFFSLRQQPFVPDMFLSLDVQVDADWATTHEPRSYFVWEFGKAPEVALEIVSNRVGRELSRKLEDYAVAGVAYYVVYDPWRNLGATELYVYELATSGAERRYLRRDDYQLPGVGLSLTLWQGVFEGTNARWLRWQDADGNLIPTGQERAEQEAARAERLAAKLRELGVEPEDV